MNNSQNDTYHQRIQTLHKEWAFLATEVSESAAALDSALKEDSPLHELTQDEHEIINEYHRSDTEVAANVAASIGGFGAGAIMMELFVDIMGGNKKKNTDKNRDGEDEDELVHTSKINRREGQKANYMRMARKEVVAKKPSAKKAQSVFADIMKNPEADRLRYENARRQRALLMAQRRELELALEKHGARQKTQQEIALAKREYQLKLERLGLLPKSFAMGLHPPASHLRGTTTEKH